MQGEEISRGRIGEMSSKELVKTRFFSTGHGVKLEGSMSYAKGRSWALWLSIYKWRRRSCGQSNLQLGFIAFLPSFFFPAVMLDRGNASPESSSSIPSLHASLDLTSIPPLLQLHLKTITISRPKDYASKPDC